MAIREFQELLRSFPEQTWSSMVQALGDGIRRADEHVQVTPMFAGEIGQDIRGHIRRVSILNRFQELSRLRSLPYEATASKMPVGSWHWLNIRSGGMTAHVVRTDDPGCYTEWDDKPAGFLRNKSVRPAEGRHDPASRVDHDQGPVCLPHFWRRPSRHTHPCFAWDAECGSLSLVSLCKTGATSEVGTRAAFCGAPCSALSRSCNAIKIPPRSRADVGQRDQTRRRRKVGLKSRKSLW
jgi:hypothetical protein